MPGVTAIHGATILEQVELDKLPWHQNPPGSQCSGIMQICVSLLLYVAVEVVLMVQPV